MWRAFLIATDLVLLPFASSHAASFDGAWAVLQVCDAGGWTAPNQDFGAFFQEDMSSTRAQSGFGLGLFVASRLCQSCDGDLTVQALDGQTVAEARFRLR